MAYTDDGDVPYAAGSGPSKEAAESIDYESMQARVLSIVRSGGVHGVTLGELERMHQESDLTIKWSSFSSAMNTLEKKGLVTRVARFRKSPITGRTNQVYVDVEQFRHWPGAYWLVCGRIP